MNEGYVVMDDHRTGHQSALRRGRYSCAGQIYHITTATRGRAPLFLDLTLARTVIHSMREVQQQCLADTLAFVIMPDHLHWLMQLGERMPLSMVIKRMKASSSLRANKRLWQEGFYDHALRRDEDVVQVARYIVANPMRAGLVARLGDYPHWDAIWL